MIHLESPAEDASHNALAEAIEADTRYARKFVRVAVPPERLDQALRPLLPLRPAAKFDLVEPLDLLRRELRGLHLDEELIEAALTEFEDRDEVRVP